MQNLHGIDYKACQVLDVEKVNLLRIALLSLKYNDFSSSAEITSLKQRSGSLITLLLQTIKIDKSHF